MTPTGNLENDHIHILKLTDIMEKITTNPDVNPEHIEQIIRLIRNFADGLHHNKEEKHLFPKMVQKGYSLQQGPVAVMLQDHQEGRNFVSGMAAALSLYNSGKTAAVADIYRNFRGYVDLLRSHIAKENNILFRMADNVMTPEDQAEMLKHFTVIDNGSDNKSQAADYVSEIDNLAGIYGI